MTKNNKILLILNIPPPYGGGEILAQYLCDNVENNENYIIIATSRNKSDKSTQGKFSAVNIYNGIRLIFLVLFKIVSQKPKKVYLLIPKQFNPFLQTAILIQLISFFRIAIMGELAGSSFVFLEKEGVKKKFGTYYLSKLTELRVLGESIKIELQKYNICALTVLENGIEVPDNNIINGYDNKILNLLYVGAITFSKGIKTLIESIPLMLSDNITLHLNLMGEWSNATEKKEIFEYIKNNNLKEFITFHGLITTTEKWSLYKSSDILVHPTYWDGQPLVILEAMGCGLPIIATKVGAIPDTLKNNYNGILLEENSAESVAKAVLYCFNNPPFLQTISENNIKTYKKKYTVNAYLSRMKNWLEK